MSEQCKECGAEMIHDIRCKTGRVSCSAPVAGSVPTISDEEILLLWGKVSNRKYEIMTIEKGPYEIEVPSNALRRIVELSIEWAQNRAIDGKFSTYPRIKGGSMK